MDWKIPVRLRAAVLEPWRSRMVENSHYQQSMAQSVHQFSSNNWLWNIIWLLLRTAWSSSPSGPALNVALSMIVYWQFFGFWTGSREPTPTLVQSLWKFQAHKFLPQLLLTRKLFHLVLYALPHCFDREVSDPKPVVLQSRLEARCKRTRRQGRAWPTTWPQSKLGLTRLLSACLAPTQPQRRFPSHQRPGWFFVMLSD